MTGWMSILCSPSNRGKWEGLEEVLCTIFHSREVHDELFPLYYFVKRKILEKDSVALNSALEWLQVCGGEEGWEERKKGREQGWEERKKGREEGWEERKKGREEGWEEGRQGGER